MNALQISAVVGLSTGADPSGWEGFITQSFPK
jgi:hypothetical protein